MLNGEILQKNYMQYIVIVIFNAGLKSDTFLLIVKQSFLKMFDSLKQ